MKINKVVVIKDTTNTPPETIGRVDIDSTIYYDEEDLDEYIIDELISRKIEIVDDGYDNEIKISELYPNMVFLQISCVQKGTKIPVKMNIKHTLNEGEEGERDYTIIASMFSIDNFEVADTTLSFSISSIIPPDEDTDIISEVVLIIGVRNTPEATTTTTTTSTTSTTSTTTTPTTS